jgi:hypothetical protein
MSFQIKPATRQGIKPLIGLYAESGCGKTMSALLMARGLVGSTGKILMIDTESGRGSLYADVIQGGYDVLEMREPFSPARYIEAIQAAEQAGVNCLVIDSASHEHEGLGGVTDMAASISRSRAEKYNKDWDGSVQFGDWKLPKAEHQKFMLKMLQTSLPVIVCLRAKYKTRQLKGTPEMAQAGAIKQSDIGRTVILKDDYTTPIQDESFIYEMTAHMEILKDHSIVVTKSSHPSLRDCFPKDKTTPITIEHGQKLAAWCNAAGKPVVAPIADKADEITALKNELWSALAAKIGRRPSLTEGQQYLWDKEILDAANVDHVLNKLSVAALKTVINKVKAI